jgi:molybdopterin-guanine dinucleotide biosynthesis protein A
MNSLSIAGTILAGGRSSRMVGRNKVLAPLAGRPLIRHVIDRVAPQVAALALSVETPRPGLETFGLPQLPDPAPGHRGPLGGLLAALRHFSSGFEWVLVAPCDAPFLPPDLAATLQARAVEDAVPCALVVYEGEPQPTFSIWHRSLLTDLEQAVGQGEMGGFKAFIRTIQATECHWPAAHPPPFFNINDAAALDRAGRWIETAGRAAHACSV